MSEKLKGKFWPRTGFVTTDLDEMVLWAAILQEKGFRFAITWNNYGQGEGVWVFAVNVNSLLAEDLIKEEGFHDEFPIYTGGLV